MAGSTEARGGHAALMDGVYRRQRHIYDATRKFFLFGRDRLIREIAPEPGQTVLEVGCGTGRNMILAARRYPKATFVGFDISEAMLETARAKIDAAGLSNRIRVVQGDATDFSTEALFGLSGADRVFCSYTLSMIPDWRAALRAATGALAPEGRLHIVDFGQLERWPGPARAALYGWLKLFHVSPRADLEAALVEVAAATGRRSDFRPLYGGYAWSATVA